MSRWEIIAHVLAMTITLCSKPLKLGSFIPRIHYAPGCIIKQPRSKSFQ